MDVVLCWLDWDSIRLDQLEKNMYDPVDFMPLMYHINSYRILEKPDLEITYLP